MITINVSDDGTPTVWNADDWLTLREKHRIVGSFIGVLGHLPHQDTFKGLPFTLLQEEVNFLVNRKIARLAYFPSLKSTPQETVKQAFRDHRETTYKEQTGHMRNERKRQLELVVDKIIEGRKKKMLGIDTKKQKKGKKKKKSDDVDEGPADCEDDNLPSPPANAETEVTIDRNTVLEEEMSKIPPLSKENTLVQTCTAFPWLREEDACPARWSFPITRIEKLRCKVYEDLWERGYFISAGHKFGGDFLVYPGDPVKFHSHYIVICVEHKAGINLLQLVRYTRVGSAVRKGLVLASQKPNCDKPMYQTVYWAGGSPL